MISTVVLHCLAGLVAGTIFNVWILFILVAAVVVECGVAAVGLGTYASLCSVGGLVALQIGYFGGIYLRMLLERAGLAQQPSIRPHHPR